jgi:hypothetical protein
VVNKTYVQVRIKIALYLKFMKMTHEDYPAFLEARRRLMAEKMRGYYFGL